MENLESLHSQAWVNSDTHFDESPNHAILSKKIAIEFKDWCADNAWYYDYHAQHTHTTDELFMIFEQTLKTQTT